MTKKENKCSHDIRTKALKRSDTEWGGNTYHRVWYCLICRNIIEVIDECYNSDATLDTFKLEEQ